MALIIDIVIYMSEEHQIELIRKAQLGDKDSFNRLAELAREPLRIYVYRLVLDNNITQDIVQERLLEMIKILDKLKRRDRFWSWLYGIALNKIHRYYRTERRRKIMPISEMGHGHAKESKQEDGS